MLDHRFRKGDQLSAEAVIELVILDPNPAVILEKRVVV